MDNTANTRRAQDTATKKRPREARIDPRLIRFCGLHDLRILLAIAAHANIDRECWPKVQTLADIAEIDLRDARRALRRLELMGLILSFEPNDTRRTTLYRIQPIPEDLEDPENLSLIAGTFATELGMLRERGIIVYPRSRTSSDATEHFNGTDFRGKLDTINVVLDVLACPVLESEWRDLRLTLNAFERWVGYGMIAWSLVAAMLNDPDYKAGEIAHPPRGDFPNETGGIHPGETGRSSPPNRLSNNQENNNLLAEIRTRVTDDYTPSQRASNTPRLCTARA